MRTGGDQVRRLALIKRPVGNLILLPAALAVIVAVAVAAGHGGGEDGALGIAMALAVMIAGAVGIQRFGRIRVLLGFNPDGLWSPGSGWLEWGQVRHIELRQSGNPVTGRRHTLWVRYAPTDTDGDTGHEVWFDTRPRLRQSRILALVEEMERCWRAAVRQPTDTPQA